MRALARAELRSPLTWAALGCLILAAFVYVFARHHWVGEWKATIDWITGAPILLGPVAAAHSALNAAGHGRLLRGLLVVTSSRRFASLAGPALMPLTLSLLVWAAAATAIIVISARAHPSDALDLLPLLRGAGHLLFFVTLGLLAGTLLPATPAALLAAAAAYLIQVKAYTVGLDFLNPQGLVGSLSQYDLDHTVVWTHVGLTLLACVTLFGLRWLSTYRRVSVWALAAGAAAAGILATATGAVAVPANIYTQKTSAKYVCHGAPIRVCLLPGNTTHLLQWSDTVNDLAAKAARLGLNFPDRFEQLADITPSPGSGSLQVDVLTINTQPPSPELVLLSLAGPTPCGAGQADGDRAMMARDLLAQWLGARLSGSGQSGDQSLNTWMHNATPQQQTAWAVKTHEALRTCRLGEATLPGQEPLS